MKKILFVFSFLLLVSAGLVSQNIETSELAKKTMLQANEAYEQQDYESAYKKINMTLEFTENLKESPNVVIIARTIYKKELEQILEEEDLVKLLDVENNLNKYPELKNEDLELLINQTKTKSEIKTEKVNIQLVEDSNRVMKNLIWLVIISLTFTVCIVLAIVIVIQIALKKHQKQQEMYIAAIQNLAENQNKANQLLLGGITEIYGGIPQLSLGGQTVWQPALALPQQEFSPEDQQELKNLAIKCEEIGSKIDKITGRKNNSKNVSELVYKLSINLGLPQGMALLNFCASMIYDAGFLGMDSSLLQATNLSEEQKEAMKQHVNLAEKYLDFVPKKYWSVFEDAVMKHHENIDGSGYPKGLKGEEIPQIARLIRVAETYVSLSSKRNYRETFDKESAVEILKSQPQFYDKAVVEALDRIV